MKILTILLLAAGLVFAAGCSGGEALSIANDITNNSRANTVVITNNGREKTFRNTDIINHSTAHSENCGDMCDHTRGELIADVVNSLEGVESATVVVYGEKAVVALELTADLDDEKLLDFKQLVESKVKQTDNGITRVAVTTCPGLTPLLAEIP